MDAPGALAEFSRGRLRIELAAEIIYQKATPVSTCSGIIVKKEDKCT